MTPFIADPLMLLLEFVREPSSCVYSPVRGRNKVGDRAAELRHLLSERPGLGDDSKTLAGVDLLSQRTPPPLVVQIPAHRLLDAGVEGLERAPAELTLELARVDRVALIVPRPVGDKRDERLVGARPRAKLIQDQADALDDIDVAALVAAPDIVFLADPASRHNEVEGASVVVDIEPVAHVLALAIDRQRLAVDGVENDERNELLGE